MHRVIKSIQTRPLLYVLPALVVLSILFFAIRWLVTDHTRYATGTIEATHVDVASKIPARVKEFAVEEGQQVNAGEVLLHFENREISAKVEQAKGAMSAAEAKYQMALHGARKQEVAMAEKAYNQAAWNVEVLKRTYDRMKALHDEAVISQQQWDEVDYRYRAAVELRDAAREKYLLVKDGARQEEKDAAKGLLHQASNAVAEAESYFDETSVRTPIKGIVEKKIVNAGELVGAGYPLVSIVDPENWWAVVNIEERTIGSLQVGQVVSCRIPARGDAHVDMRVARISAMSDFATKRATNELNSFDTRSFEVKLVPVDSSIRILEGLTILVPLAH